MDGVERIRATLSAGYEQNHPFRVQRQSDRGSHPGKHGQDQEPSEGGTGHEDRIELHVEDSSSGVIPPPKEEGEEENLDGFHLDIAV